MKTTNRAKKRCKAFALFGALTVGLLCAASVQAKPQAPALVCETVTDAAACAGHLVSCSTCHTSTAPPAWNAYGLQIMGQLKGGAFDTALPPSITATLALDADSDGVSNAEELRTGTNPGDPTDVWPYCREQAIKMSAISADYDYAAALQRVYVTLCGRAATHAEMTNVRGLVESPQLYKIVHAAASSCLESAYWRDEALARLADAKIRPLSVLGPAAPYGVSLGDYDWDYRLFSYALTNNRDVRDLLVATYHVRRTEDGTLERVDGIVAPNPPSTFMMGAAGGQTLAPARRAGMITTQWFLTSNTLFSALPRITAAQAYRAYLGNDIAHTEGLRPVAGEPLDIDDKGVSAPACAVCHSTLDPLSYAFSTYEGIGGGSPGEYSDARPSRVMPKWSNNKSSILGHEVGSLLEWAEVAAQTDDFKRTIALDLFHQLYGRAPELGEQEAFRAAWKALPADGWSANRLVHRLIDMPTFGGGKAQ